MPKIKLVCGFDLEELDHEFVYWDDHAYSTLTDREKEQLLEQLGDEFCKRTESKLNRSDLQFDAYIDNE